MSKRDETLQKAFSLHRSGNFAEAAKLYRKIIRRDPRQADAHHSLGIIESAGGNFAEAAALMARSVALQPANVEFMQNYATVLCRLGQFEAAGGVCVKGLELAPGNVYLLYVAGAALLQQDRLQDALEKYDALLAREPDHVAALTERSSVHMALEQYEAASADIGRAIALRPHYADAHLNRGILAGRLGHHGDAVAAFEHTLKLNPNSANAWLGLGNVFFDRKRASEALAAIDRALTLAPGAAEAWLGRGNVLFDLRQGADALAAYDKALTLRPALAEAWIGRGNVLFDAGRHAEALSAYDKALAFKPQSAEAGAGRGHALAGLKRPAEAIAAYGEALARKGDLAGLQGDRIFARMQLCDWNGIDAETDRMLQAVRAGEAVASPFNLFVTDASPADQLRCARSWTERRYPAQPPLWRGERFAHERIRIGYVSADFRQHPVGYLAAGLFEAHDRARFEVIGFSIGPDDGSDIRRRLAQAFDRFIDVAALGVDEVARRIRAEEIDLLVDLNGFTQNARPGIFARRPAPVQVNYLGFPGTMGADYIDYIVADSVLVPRAHHDAYAEKVVTLPHSYMPHDAAGRAISETGLERAQFGLPDDAFVFCCFNNAYKVNPRAFASQMRILKAVEGSVLWLSENHPAAVAHLRQHAADAGVAPERLVFATRVASMADHLARHRLADLFLDTLPYNAHTTASDALWAGLPVLTAIGESFAGRVAASLLTAIGLPELIVQTVEQFENRAIEFATVPEKLSSIRERLAKNRSTSALFDTQLFARHLEAAYATMMERSRAGLSPQPIQVVPLS
jgi:predicted O-linked N-acetylglucosamine transferase (SPINDLY family)